MRTPFRAPTPPPRLGDRAGDRSRDFQPPHPDTHHDTSRHTSLAATPPRTHSTPASPAEESPVSYDSDIRSPTRDPRPAITDSVVESPILEKPALRRPTGEHSFIDRHTTIEGTLRSAKDLRIEGRVNGEIVCDGKLIIAEGAVVQARVEAAEIVVTGSLEGDLQSHGQFKLQPSGVVRGSATAARIAIEDGASYEGELHMTSAPPHPDEVAETPLSGVLAARQPSPARSNGNGGG